MKLILVRHGQSTANADGRFTGSNDAQLTDQGQREAIAIADQLREVDPLPRRIFFSPLTRCIVTAGLIARRLDLHDPMATALPGLGERDYGALTGMLKSEAADRYGAEQLRIWRRSFAVAPPGGESLRETAARVFSAYITDILPALIDDESVLVVAHGNSLRALVMVLDRMSPDDVEHLEIATGEAIIYTLAFDSRVTDKVIVRAAEVVGQPA